MFTNKKVLVLATTDNMIWQFLIPHIQEMQKAGNVVECACNKSGFWFDELKEKYGFTMHEIHSARNPVSPKNIKAYKELKKLVKQNGYNLIYCQQPVGGLFGRLLAKKFKIPCIYTAHGFHFFKGAPLKNNLIFKPVEKYLAKYTDILITINEEDYQAAKKMKAKKVFKIHGIGFVNKTQSEKNVDQIREELGIGKKDFVLISVGELNENKNHLAVLKAVAELHVPNFTYVICGQGPRRQEYETFIAKHNLQNVVKLLGFRKDVQDILKASDAFIMPSFREGLPMSMMEAMNLGLPILASNIRGCKDLVAVERNGFLFEPTNIAQMKEQILKLYKNKNLCEKIRKNNLEDIKQYSVENVKKELNEIYKEV